MNVDKAFADVDMTWERDLVPTMPQECVGNYIAHVSMMRLIVDCGIIYCLT